MDVTQFTIYNLGDSDVFRRERGEKGLRNKKSDGGEEKSNVSIEERKSYY